MATKQNGKKAPQKRKVPSTSGEQKPKNNKSMSKNETNKSFTSEDVERSKLYHNEIILIVTLVISLLCVLSYFNFSGILGDWVNHLTFGLFGFMAYLFPFLLFFSVAFYIANKGNPVAKVKLNSTAGLFVLLSALIQMINHYSDSFTISEFYLKSATTKSGGGLIGGLICRLFYKLFGVYGTYIVIIAIMLILLMFITGKALLTILSNKSKDYFVQIRERNLDEPEYEVHEQGDIQESNVYRKAKTVLLNKVKTDSDNKRKMDMKQKNKSKDNVHDMIEITGDIDSSSVLNGNLGEDSSIYENLLDEKFGHKNDGYSNPNIDDDIDRLIRAANGDDNSMLDATSEGIKGFVDSIASSNVEMFKPANTAIKSQHVDKDLHEDKDVHEEGLIDDSNSNTNKNNKLNDKGKDSQTTSGESLNIDQSLNITQTIIEKKEYKFPPLDLLTKPKLGVKGMSDKDLKDTAIKLQKTLESFGVRVTITNVSCGPAVTRYELQPEQGVKVSKITGLADDIKLNLAAADVRIEAPIPGKAAVGIEVPNKENTAVMFRELIEGLEFKKHNSNIAFAVGKDIGGQTMVTDIGKMPHLLIAGATGSGKSVCINTLIMSILYKAKPSDVRMIMIDPKVVELSVYNGIPHLLIPVVTDPKKASAALNWAVMEMTERYKKFADLGVRDIKGYNDKIATVKEYQDERYQKLPQIVIIVDELADLMMVAPGEVEDAICRLAQMARAAGLHLIIATQRPSVNVITGLIKANIPSRIAFSVSSAIDSRTIIDGSGAEKLLGKGDMLFFPSGYPKPVRVQGAFVSDKEVSSVVEFLTTNNSTAQYSEDVVNKIANVSTNDTSNPSGGNERDEYFVEAGKFIIEKDKASIGMLQRVYKIGFNRAARIMDQLSEAGVVGPEEGTKPRKILMSLEEFETYIDEYV